MKTLYKFYSFLLTFLSQIMLNTLKTSIYFYYNLTKSQYFSKRNPLNFWSPHISGCQRLKSGNTLICEGGKGRIFEVTPSGEIVWEYINPFFGPHPAYTDSEINWVFRAKRYSSDSPQIQNRV